MGLRKFERRRTSICPAETTIERDGANLRLVQTNSGWTPRIVELSLPVDIAAQPRYTYQAEVRAKRFGDWTVADDRYVATVSTSDNSPHGVLSALAEACAGMSELRRAGVDDQHLILQVSLVTSS